MCVYIYKAFKSHTQQIELKFFYLSDNMTGSNKRESLTDVQHSAVHKTANIFLFSACATSTLFELFHPPPSSPNPLDLFPSQLSCSLHTLGLSRLPCPHNYHHHWGCGKRVQSPTPGRGCRP